MFESNYNYVPNPYPPAPQPGPQPGYHPYPQPMPGPGPVVPAPVFVDPTLTIPRAAADAAVTGKLLAAKLSLDKLVGSIKLVNDKLELDGLVDAESGQVPSKGEDGSIEWIDAARASDVISIKDNLQSQLNTISSSLETQVARIDELFDVNAQQDTRIAEIKELVNNLNSVINGEDGQPGLSQRIDAVETGVEQLTTELDSKLDAAIFNAFLQDVINGENGLVARLTELEGCCEDVQSALSGINAQLNDYYDILGGPENYDQPVYMTLNELKNMDIDGGDLDEEEEP